MQGIKIIISIACFSVLFCGDEIKNCTEVFGTEACNDLESNCSGEFNRIVFPGSAGYEKCNCCE